MLAAKMRASESSSSSSRAMNNSVSNQSLNVATEIEPKVKKNFFTEFFLGEKTLPVQPEMNFQLQGIQILARIRRRWNGD